MLRGSQKHRQSNLNLEKGDTRVYYPHPATILLKDPDEQKVWRKEYIKSISEVPGPEPLQLIADELQKYCFENLRDMSTPDEQREILYKVGLNVNFVNSKVQFELENCIKRVQRLEGDDHFKENIEEKPVKTILEQSKLVMDQHIPQQEYAETVIRKEGNKLIDMKLHKQTPSLEQIVKSLYPPNKTQMTEKQRTQRFHSFKEPKPFYINNLIQLKAIVREKAKQFNVVGDIDIDNGHSFSYNVTIMFPALFQKQVVLSTFPVYDGINDNLIMDYHLD